MHVNTIKENTKNKPINPIALTPEQIKAWMWPSEVWVVAEGNCITYYFSREAEGWCRPRAWCENSRVSSLSYEQTGLNVYANYLENGQRSNLQNGRSSN